MRLTFTVTQNVPGLTKRTALYERISRSFLLEIQRRNIPAFQDRIDTSLNRDPGPVRRPIAWISERQKKHVIAKLRREGNLPYRRTGAVRKWKADARRNTKSAESGVDIHISNEAPYSKYVYGNRQQPFHSNTGWFNVDFFVNVQQKGELRSAIIRTWNDLALPPEASR